jgi:hypothetical protein
MASQVPVKKARIAESEAYIAPFRKDSVLFKKIFTYIPKQDLRQKLDLELTKSTFGHTHLNQEMFGCCLGSRTEISDFVQTPELWHFAHMNGYSGLKICNAIVRYNGNLEHLLIAKSEGYSFAPNRLLTTAMCYGRINIVKHLVEKEGADLSKFKDYSSMISNASDKAHFYKGYSGGELEVLQYTYEKGQWSEKVVRKIFDSAIHIDSVDILQFVIAKELHIYNIRETYQRAAELLRIQVIDYLYKKHGLTQSEGDELVAMCINGMWSYGDKCIDAFIWFYEKGFGKEMLIERLHTSTQAPYNYIKLLRWMHTVPDFPFSDNHVLQLVESGNVEGIKLAAAAGMAFQGDLMTVSVESQCKGIAVFSLLYTCGCRPTRKTWETLVRHDKVEAVKFLHGKGVEIPRFVATKAIRKCYNDEFMCHDYALNELKVFRMLTKMAKWFFEDHPTMWCLTDNEVDTLLAPADTHKFMYIFLRRYSIYGLQGCDEENHFSQRYY